MKEVVHPEAKEFFYAGLSATALSCVGLFSRWKFVRVTGLTELMAVTYATASNLVGCRDCIEFYTLDRIYVGESLNERLIRSLNPDLNAVSWGIWTGWWTGLIGGLCLATVARSSIKLGQLFAWMAGGGCALLAVTHGLSKLGPKLAKAEWYKHYVHPTGLNEDQLTIRWASVWFRNVSGYAGAVSGLVGFALLNLWLS